MLDQLAQTLANCSRCAVLTGAGISAESGVPTFRGKDGLWGKFKAEELATMEAFMSNPKMVWEWYNWRRELMGKVKPNPGHLALAELESIIPTFCLITQNVDGLHRQAGSETILELHGNIHFNKCLDCNAPFPGNDEIDPDTVPRCERCGGQIRPDVVWFGEMLNQATIEAAFEAAETAEVFMSIGTSALVHPAANLPVAARRHGATLIEINPEQTSLTPIADLYFPVSSGVLLPDLVKRLKTMAAS